MNLFAENESHAHQTDYRSDMLEQEKVSLQKRNSDQTIGELIKSTRKEKHLSQKSLASLCGITAVQMNRIESGDSIPSKESLKAISAHISIPYTELLLKAGYNNMAGEFKLFNKDGNELDAKKLICSIYRADSDLLELFLNFETLATHENVELLKLLLKAMRKEAQICNDSSQTESWFSSYFRKTFSALKTFIISSLKPITG